MSGVFLSYSRADRDLAIRIVGGLRVLGVDVWWDEDMRGVDWQEELQRQIDRLDGVLVLWTPNSLASKNVRDEARLSLNTDKLVNLLYGAAEPPFPFDRVHGMALDGWTGREPHRGWTRLVETLDERMAARGSAEPGAIAGALTEREARQRTGQRALTEAQEAFQTAQLAAADADDTARATATAAAAAESQLQQVVQIHASTAIRQAAQAELDAASAAKAAADTALGATRANLSEASRQLTVAERALDALHAEQGSTPAEPPKAPASGQAIAAPVAHSSPSASPELTEWALALRRQVAALLNLMFGFSGRIGRRPFWLGHIGAVLVLGIVFGPLLDDHEGLAIPVVALYHWPVFALNAKRAHDRGRDGWFGAIGAIPIAGWIWGFFVLGLGASEPGPNRYGPPVTAD